MSSAAGTRSGGLRVGRLPSPVQAPLVDWLRGSPTGLVALALATGLAAGVGAVVFRLLIAAFTVAFTGIQDYSGSGGAPNPLVPGLGPWFIIAVPVLGGFLYGPLIDRFAREARGHGVPEVMLAVAQEGGRIRPRVAVVKSLASAICLGAGGSVGREGPIVQVGSAVGSTVGQALRLGESNLRLLVACGAAGGISATFNAPIAGVFFALELILRDFEVRSFGVVVLASVVADVLSRMAFGNTSFLQLPAFQITSLAEYPLYAVLGVLAAGAGLLFIRGLYGAEDVVDRLWAGRPEWLRPAVGGLLLGAILLLLPQLYGVGYTALESALHGDFGLQLLLLLLAGKIAATSLTIAIGGSGGVFAPSLYIGGMLGMAFGLAAGQVLPDVVGSPGAYALVGMGAVFASAARAPITSVLIMFELTGDYQIILPLMLAIALAAGISNLVTEDTIYTLKLRRRGVDVRRGRPANFMEVLTVAEAMRRIPAAVPASLTLGEAVDHFVGSAQEALPVVDEEGRYVGVVTAQQIEGSMRENALDATAGSLAQHLPTLTPGETLEHALGLLVRREVSGLPVVATAGEPVIGWLTHRDILRAYAARLGAEVAAAERTGAGRAPGPLAPGLLGTADRVESVGRADAVGRLRDYRIVDLEVGGGSELGGRRMADLPWPTFSLPIAVRRGERSFRPGPATVLEVGDRLTVLAPQDVADRIDESLLSIEPPAPERAPTPGQDPTPERTSTTVETASGGDETEAPPSPVPAGARSRMDDTGEGPPPVGAGEAHGSDGDGELPDGSTVLEEAPEPERVRGG